MSSAEVDQTKGPATAKARSLSRRAILPSGEALTTILNRLNAILASVSGLDKTFMLIQYSAPLIALLLRRSTTFPLTMRLGSGNKAGSRRAALSASLLLISAKLSDWRTVGRFFGLLPIISWVISLEKAETAPQNQKLRNIQRAQALSMLLYYPLEHAWYLASQGIISMSPSRQLQTILWACRAWAAYVALQLLHYSEEARDLSARMAFIAKRRAQLSTRPAHLDTATTEKEVAALPTEDIIQDAGTVVEEATLLMNERECYNQSKKLVNGVMTNLAYAPLTVHWSLENGLFKNSMWSNVFGTSAAITQLQAAWNATA